MTPYPLIYCPAGVQRPLCCPHPGGVAIKPGMGPDGDAGASSGWGLCFGGPMDRSQPWRRTPAGWWVLLTGHRPQHLVRMQLHPRIMRWRTVAGAETDHAWRVPVLIAPNQDAPQPSYLPATDQVWNGMDWRSADELLVMQESLLAIGDGVPMAIDPDERNACVRRLAVQLIAMGQWIDEDFLAAAGWLTETLMIAVLLAGMDQSVQDVTP